MKVKYIFIIILLFILFICSFQTKVEPLNNKNFTDRAPKDIVEHEQKKREQYQSTIKKIEDNLKSLKN